MTNTTEKSITDIAGVSSKKNTFWMSRKQKNIATSTVEVKYAAMAVTTKQGQWIAQVLQDSGYPQYISRNSITV